MAMNENIGIKSEPIDQDVSNPWLVDSIQAFTYFKCPECLFDTQEVYR